MVTRAELERISALLAEHHADAFTPASRDLFELVLWEQVAYLAKYDRRAKAFELLKEKVGTTPDAVLGASLKELTAIARVGGAIAAGERAERMKRSAELAPIMDGIAALPLNEARKRLSRFPMIGAPGADKLLMMSGLFPVFAIESNGLRVLLRLGVAKEEANYSASYRSVMKALEGSIPAEADARTQLYHRLRVHGLQVCKRARPRCEGCSLRPYCRLGRSTLAR